MAQRGADLNAADNEGMTAAMHAARNGRAEVHQLTLGHGLNCKKSSKAFPFSCTSCPPPLPSLPPSLPTLHRK